MILSITFSLVCVKSLFWPMLARSHGVKVNRMLTAADLMATGVIVNKQFLKVTYNPFNSFAALQLFWFLLFFICTSVFC